MGAPAFRIPSMAINPARLRAVYVPRLKPKNEDFIAVVVIFDKPVVSQTDVVIEPLAEHTAQKTVDPDLVVDELQLAVRAFRGSERSHAPDVRIAVDAVPRAIKEKCEALLFLLCAGKVRLDATFFRRTANNNRDRDDDPDRKKKDDPVRDPLDPSQNFHRMAPSCVALADPRENRRACRRVSRLLIRCTSRSNNAPSTW